MIMKYTCEEMQELLSLYLDDMLEGDEIYNVKSHLLSCNKCKAEYDELLELKKLLSEIPEVPVPKIFDRRLAKGIKKEKLRHNRKRFKAIVSVAALFMVGIFSYVAMDSMDIFDQGKEQAIPQSTSSIVAEDVASASAINDEADNKKSIRDKEQEALNEAEAERVNAEKVKAEAELQRAQEDATKKDAEAKAKAKLEAEAKAKAEALAKATAEADAKAKAAAAAKAKAKAKATAEAAKVAAENANSAAAYSADSVDNDVAQYYEMIHQSFVNQDYKIKNYSQKNPGEWQFTVVVSEKKDDNSTVDKNVIVTGKDGGLIW